MSGAALSALAANPQLRALTVNAARATVRAVGRSRRRRQGRGKWYFGRKIGIPPNIERTPIRSAPVSLGQQIVSRASAASRRVTGTEQAMRVYIDYAPVQGTWKASSPINPCEEFTFPRLSAEGHLYQQYKCQSLSFIYTPSCASTTEGAIAIGFQADPTRPIPDSIEDMGSLFGTQTGSVWQPMRITIPPRAIARTLPHFYAQQSSTPAPADDDRMQTCGRLVVITSGVAEGTVCGVIRAQYTFEFSDPRPQTQGAVSCAHETFGNHAVGYYQTSEATTRTGIFPYFGTNHILYKRNSYPVLLYARWYATSGVGDIQVHDLNGAAPVAVTPVTTYNDPSTTSIKSALWILPSGRGKYGFYAFGASLPYARFTSMTLRHDIVDAFRAAH